MLPFGTLSGIIPSGPESSSRVHNRLFLPKIGNNDDEISSRHPEPTGWDMEAGRQ